MAEPTSTFSASLYTPASDLVFGGDTNFEIIIGRKGNDTIYGDVPVANSSQGQNIDFLFGDLFDNSVQEYGTILAIGNGNPLAILGTDLPTAGADRFVLGDENQPYYVSSDPSNLTTTNLLGLNEFAVIYDFNPAQDTIQLNGTAKDYLLVDVNGLKVEGVDQLFYGKAVFSLQNGAPDLVTYIIEKPDVTLSLTDKYFQYTGTKPKGKPGSKKIDQLATTGVDLSLSASNDPSGNLYLAGSTTGPLQGTNLGSTDAWIAKYNSSGTQVWGKQIGTAKSETAYDTVTDSAGNLYVAGATSGNLFSTLQTGGDAWVAKYDTNGNQVWGKQFQIGNGLSNTPFGIDLDPTGNVYVSGLTIKDNPDKQTFNFPVQDDSWVTKFDNNGNQQWTTQIGGPFFDENYNLAVDNSGNSYAVGWTQGLLRESDPSRSLLKYDAWIQKTNTSGQVEWRRQFGSKNEGIDFAWDVDTDSKGNIYVAGWTTGDIGTTDGKKSKLGSYDMWITKFAPDGTQVVTKEFGSAGDDGTYLSDMVIDAQDNIFVTGYSNDKLGKGSKDDRYNAFVAKFDTNVTNQWVQQFGSKSKLDYATGISVDNTGKLYVTGVTDGVLGSGTTATDRGSVDAWVAAFDADKGNLQRFTGNSKDVDSIVNPSAISTVDSTNDIVTEERLPNGDNIINPSEGTATPQATASVGQLSSTLQGIFSPSNQGSISNVLATGVSTNNAPFLNSSDLNAL